MEYGKLNCTRPWALRSALNADYLCCPEIAKPSLISMQVSIRHAHLLSHWIRDTSASANTAAYRLSCKGLNSWYHEVNQQSLMVLKYSGGEILSSQLSTEMSSNCFWHRFIKWVSLVFISSRMFPSKILCLTENRCFIALFQEKALFVFILWKEFGVCWLELRQFPTRDVGNWKHPHLLIQKVTSYLAYLYISIGVVLAGDLGSRLLS